MRYPALILFLVSGFLADSVLAANWHPFPFKISYYGVKTTLGAHEGQNWQLPFIPSNGPLTSGFVVDGLYLDQSFLQGTAKGKRRSAKYPVGEFFSTSNGADFMPFIQESSVITSTDSHSVIVTIGSNFSLSGDYFPKDIRVGDIAFNSNGMVTAIVVRDVFGQPDSVANVKIGTKNLLWSKRFGIIKSMESELNGVFSHLELVGVKDLGLGYQDILGTLPNPQPGDEFHFLNLSKGYINCSSQFGNTEEYDDTFNKLQVKVLSAGSDGVNVKIIASEPGATTGIEYTDYTFYFENGSQHAMAALNDSIRPVGSAPFNFSVQFLGQVNFLGWIDTLGNQFKVLRTEVMDGTPNVQFFTCSKMPYASMTSIYYMMNSFCSGSIQKFQYPVYAKIQGRCTFGTPFDSVTITETKPIMSSSRSFTISPNPVENQFQISGISDGEYVISDSFGKVRNRGIVSDQPIDVQGLPSGIYFVHVKKDGKFLRSKKVVKE